MANPQSTSLQQAEDNLFKAFDEAGMSPNDIIDYLIAYVNEDQMRELAAELREYMTEE